MASQGKDKPFKYEAIEFTGKLITSVDPAQLGKGDMQELINARYNDKGPVSISGMSKINSTPVTKTDITAAFHFKKESIPESHFLVQGFANDGSSALYDNTTSIPNQGNFSLLYSETTGSSSGKFFNAPDGCVVYGNTKEMILWGGNESRCSAFIVADANDYSSTPTIALDYTDQVTDFDTTTYAVISSRYVHIASTRELSGVKFYVKTANTSTASVSAYYWSGTAWTAVASLSDGTASSGKTLAQTGMILFTSTVGSTSIRFFQNVLLYYYLFDFNGVDATTSVYRCTVVAPPQSITNQWDGVPLQPTSYQVGNTSGSSYTSSSFPPGQYLITDTDTTTTPSTITDYTSNILYAESGGSSSEIAPADHYTIIGSQFPLTGAFFDVYTNNTLTVSVTVSYWNGYNWTSVSGLSDGTASGGVTLAKNGTISFSDTNGAAAVRYFNGVLLYWYWFNFNGIDAATRINQITLTTSSTLSYTSYSDHTARVLKKDYVANPYGAPTTYDNTTYSNIYGSSGDLFIGFAERMQGLLFDIGSTFNNQATNIMTVSYWNGSAWSVLTVTDHTTDGASSLAKSGAVVWEPPDSSDEFKTSINNPYLYYYYRVHFNSVCTNAGAIVAIDAVAGIPESQYDLNNYKFATMFQNRLVLCNDQNGYKNSILIGASNTNCVFNGTDSTQLLFGDEKEIVSAMPFFSRFSNNFFENLFVGKTDSVYIVDGTSPDTYAVYKIASMYGVEAPNTLTACDIGFQASGTNVTRNIILWQSSGAIALWDGSTVYPIHEDIKDVFDQKNSYAIEPSMASYSESFYDVENHEWHWLWASQGNTTLNKEYVFDVIRKKWFKIDRGTGKRIQLGTSVVDNYGNRYVYAATTDGYIERLENGQTFDGNSITTIIHTGDIPLGGWMIETGIRKIKPIVKTLTTTTNTLELKYYTDTALSKTLTYPVVSSTKRLTSHVESIAGEPSIFHSFRLSMTTNNEDICLEPIGIGIFYKQIREDLVGGE